MHVCTTTVSTTVRTRHHYRCQLADDGTWYQVYCHVQYVQYILSDDVIRMTACVQADSLLIAHTVTVRILYVVLPSTLRAQVPARYRYIVL